MHNNLTNKRVAVIGLGYVGLPLALLLSQKYKVTGFDVNPSRIAELQSGHDRTLEVTSEQLDEASQLSFTSVSTEIDNCDIYIITVPTPIDDNKQPDLTALNSASQMVGTMLSKGDYVIYESTVYPGVTEEVCAPILEQSSGLKLNKGFFLGYSPERANPGDSEHKVDSIVKVTSGSTQDAARLIDELYASVITAGTHLASSIRVAEAAKVIENIQRDVNIALVNELALLFNRLNIDTNEVLEAAGTKWNFLPFRPGLVGGHCIGVDPYYLAQKAQSVGFHPEIILAGRRVNDGVGVYVADELVRCMVAKKINVAEAKVLIMGLTFKENCPDIRNTHVVDILNRLESYDIDVDVYDPWVDASSHSSFTCGSQILDEKPSARYDGIMVAVSHQEFLDMTKEDFEALQKSPSVLYDVKGRIDRSIVDARL